MTDTHHLAAIVVANMQIDSWTQEELIQFAFCRLTTELRELSPVELRAQAEGALDEGIELLREKLVQDTALELSCPQ